MMVKFESLPNEILLDCFEYLNGIDLYRAFDGLNYRFYLLIRNIPLHTNFEYATKEIFDRFCTGILLRPYMKNEILSLHLSDMNGTHDQAQLFLSMFRLNEFSHLRSLTLVGIVSIDIKQVQSMLSSLFNLQRLVIKEQNFNVKIQQAVSLPPTLKALSVPKLYFRSIFMDKTVPVTHLTLTESCSHDTLYDLFRCMTMLKYFKLTGGLSAYSRYISNPLDSLDHPIVSLTHLIIYKSDLDKLEYYKSLFKQMPNLKLLTLFITDKEEIFDGDRWQDMISLFLPQLKVFNFVFKMTFYHSNREKISCQFKKFQTDFWYKQHSWYTKWELRGDFEHIYTIPYCLNTDELEPVRNIDCNASINDLTLFEKQVNQGYRQYFSNMKSFISKLISRIYRMIFRII